MRKATAADLQPGDLLLFRRDFVDAQPAGVPWKIACEAIALGESLFRPNPRYVHVAIVAGPALDTIEELPQGCVEDTEILDARFDVCRPRWRTPDDAAKFVGFIRQKLNTPYAWGGLAVIGMDRIFHTGLAEHLNLQIKVCSTLGAWGLKQLGYDCWPGLLPDQVAPADYPGAGMVMIVQAGNWLGG